MESTDPNFVEPSFERSNVWLESAPDSSQHGVISIGNFDGVHLGHAALIRRLRELSQRHESPTVIVTFDPSPSHVLYPDQAPRPLSSIQRRIELLKLAGADEVIVLQPTPGRLSVGPREFFQQVVVEGLKARGMVEGPNFRFGHARSGDVDLLKTLCAANSMSFEVVEPEISDGMWISSTRIRQLISDGEIELANRFLTEPYRIRGVVEHGAHRGRTIGFPTANLGSISVQTPNLGVYAARVVDCYDDKNESIQGMKSKPVALHIGPNPTFGEDARKLEAHIIGYRGEIYGASLELELLAKIRGVIKFESLDALTSQLHRDIAVAESIAGKAKSDES